MGNGKFWSCERAMGLFVISRVKKERGLESDGAGFHAMLSDKGFIL